MEDWELLEVWRGGDDAAGQQLVGRYLGSLTRFFNNKVANPEDAAELISETMLACVKNKERVEDATAFRSFLFATAMNMLRRYFRKQVKRQREVDDFADVVVGESERQRSMTSHMHARRETQLLVRALRHVSLDQQIVLELNYVEGLNGNEIAELLGLPAPTVYTRLRRAKERLKGVMAELAEDPSVVSSTMDGLSKWAAEIRQEIDR